MNEHEKWHALLPWYVNGTLKERSRIALEAHLQACPTCRQELAVWRRISIAVKTQSAPKLPHDARSHLPTLARPQPWNTPRLIPLLLRSQLHVIRGEIWPASALVLGLGVVVALATGAPAGEMLPFVLIAPIVAAVGISFLYGPAVAPTLEIELVTPTPPRLVLLARLLLVFGFDLMAALTGSLALTLFEPDISLGPLIGAWLVPMVFLSALSLLFSILTADPGAGTLISLTLWTIHALQQLGMLDRVLKRLPDLSAATTRPWILLLAFLMGGLALWLSGHEERWMKGRT
jgi:hypothetical protein